MIRAIETSYAGCRFRSRLEARWAVFFDRLQIEWEYEAQGYETRAGRYLPDFWLPDLRIWIEVKGVLSHADLVRTAGAVWELQEPTDGQVQHRLLFLGPVPRPGQTWSHVELDLLGEFMLWQRVYFHPEPAWHLKPTAQAAVLQRDSFVGAAEELTSWFCEDAVLAASEPRIAIDPDVDAAYAAARSARFEFGGA